MVRFSFWRLQEPLDLSRHSILNVLMILMNHVHFSRYIFNVNLLSKCIQRIVQTPENDQTCNILILPVSEILDPLLHFSFTVDSHGLLHLKHDFSFLLLSETNYLLPQYADHSVTQKACAGLNGMRLGGQVVTAVFATPEAALVSI